MDFATARRKMVDNQVRPNDVTDLRLVAAMLEIPRERFVPTDRAAMAYADRDLEIDEGGSGSGSGRSLLKPMVLARLLQAAAVQESDHVLDVACGTGYSTAVLARLSRSVVGLEDSKSLAQSAERLLKELGAANAAVVAGPLGEGWPAGAPYDLVLVNGAVEFVPEKLLDQIKEGGRLVTVEGIGPVGKAVLYQRAYGDVSSRTIFDATAPVLPNFVKPKTFVF